MSKGNGVAAVRPRKVKPQLEQISQQYHNIFHKIGNNARDMEVKLRLNS